MNEPSTDLNIIVYHFIILAHAMTLKQIVDVILKIFCTAIHLSHSQSLH